MPALLADDPANVSSEASRLRATLNKIVNHDLNHDAAITPLLQTLARENREQGIVRMFPLSTSAIDELKPSSFRAFVSSVTSSTGARSGSR